MKRPITAALGVLLLVGLAWADDKAARKDSAPAGGQPALRDLKQKASYGIGVSIGKNLKQQKEDIDAELVVRGIQDAIGSDKLALSDEEIADAIQSYQAQVSTKRQDALKAASEKNKKEGEEFLEANKKKPGVVTLPSGLQYKVLKEGKGKQPKATDVVDANYRGTLLDGTEFDSTAKRGKPATFAVSGVIPGWTEALQLMKEGSKWQLFIPSNLAYGANPRPGPIGPNATLVFEVELVAVKPGQ